MQNALRILVIVFWQQQELQKYSEMQASVWKWSIKLVLKGRHLLDVIQKGEAQFVINTLTKGKQPERDGFRIRRESVENGIPCFTSLDTAEAMLRVIESMTFQTEEMRKAGGTCMIIQDQMIVTSQQQIAHNIFEMTVTRKTWSGKLLPRASLSIFV